MCLFVASLRPKTERPVLDRPLKVGGGIQPRLVTVLTPATTFTVGEDFIQNRFLVNSTKAVIYYFYCFRRLGQFAAQGLGSDIWLSVIEIAPVAANSAKHNKKIKI